MESDNYALNRNHQKAEKTITAFLNSDKSNTGLVMGMIGLEYYHRTFYLQCIEVKQEVTP
jgi:hypothetical protein